MLMKLIVIFSAVYICLLAAPSPSASAAVVNGNSEHPDDAEKWLVQDQRALSKSICPHGFTYVSSARSCYAVVTQKLVWPVAGLHCRSLHNKAHLVVINNAEEQEALATLLDHTLTKGCYTTNIGTLFWTAGQRIDPSYESTFIWRTSHIPTDEAESIMKYTNWERHQPSSGEKASCMNMWTGHGATWNDDSCRAARCSVCELEIFYVD